MEMYKDLFSVRTRLLVVQNVNFLVQKDSICSAQEMESTNVAVTKQLANVLGLGPPASRTVTNKVSCPVLVGACCLDQNVKRLFNFSLQHQIARKSC